MISVHNRAAQTFTATGLAVLDREIIDPVVSEELGSHFMLSFSYPADGSAAKHLRLENIVATPVPGVEDRQGFRIAEVVTTLGGMLEVTAHHVFYDLSANLVSDTYVVNKTAADALKQLLDAANSKHGFTASSSDTSTRASARIVRQSLAAAILDAKAENSFVSRWGGELAFDNWRIHHAPRRGRDAMTGCYCRNCMSPAPESMIMWLRVSRSSAMGRSKPLKMRTNRVMMSCHLRRLTQDCVN